MSEPTERYTYLLDRYTRRACTWEEYRELFSYLDKEENKDALLRFMDQKYVLSEASAGKTAEEWDFMYHNMMTGLPKKKRPYRWFGYMAAAAILLVCGVGVALWHNPADPQVILTKNGPYKNDIAPGGNKAMLTLADGSVIALDDHGNKVISTGAFVSKTEDGQLMYQQKPEVAQIIDEYNTLTTPRAGQYKLILADGSKVWLNAASSLKYPTAFNGDYRKVVLTGEAYFEIAANKEKPFIVETGEAEVKVLGTHFNIMSYQDERYSETTLLEGSIQFSRGSRQILLKPGQQVQYQSGIGHEKLIRPDLEGAMAWRNGVFVFDNTNIEDIMRSVKRWYDVDVVYKGAKPVLSFTGVIPRTGNISKVLKILESAGDIGFEIDGKTVTCSKNRLL
jgi:ferric-dicitrate binding protein FerR (iron transport regulator)